MQSKLLLHCLSFSALHVLSSPLHLCSLKATGPADSSTLDCSAHTEGGEPAADEAEETDSAQSRRGLFWMPPADNEPGVRDMLHLDDELAGLIEAADMPADQHGAHVRKPEPTSSVQGEGSVEQRKPFAVLTVPLLCQLWLFVIRLTLW